MTLRVAHGDVEPALGQIERGRRFRQFLFRRLEKVNGEWSITRTHFEVEGLKKVGLSG